MVSQAEKQLSATMFFTIHHHLPLTTWWENDDVYNELFAPHKLVILKKREEKKKPPNFISHVFPNQPRLFVGCLFHLLSFRVHRWTPAPPFSCIWVSGSNTRQTLYLYWQAKRTRHLLWRWVRKTIEFKYLFWQALELEGERRLVDQVDVEREWEKEF